MLSRIFLITGLVLVTNIGLALVLIGLLRRRHPWPKRIGIVVVAWLATMCLLFFLQLFTPDSWVPFMRRWLYFPFSVEMVWNLLFALPLFLFTLVTAFFLRFLRPVKSQSSLPPDGISRRQFLYAAAYGVAPVVAIGMGVHGSITRSDLRVRPFSIPITGLPPELEGFTIAHVSDLHSGVFVGPKRLKIISDTTNDLKADLVTITGDVINREMSEFSSALAAMKALESRHGTYLCEGNHDLIPGPEMVRNACVENNLPMLSFESVILPIRGRRLILGGLPWMKDGVKPRPEMVSQLFPERREGDVRLLLAHHPHLFDIADSADLVLCGHTHGGQIMLNDHFGLGPTFFDYWSGLYQRNTSSLVVSNGCGDWFPCRIGAPAEIIQVTLKAA